MKKIFLSINNSSSLYKLFTGRGFNVTALNYPPGINDIKKVEEYEGGDFICLVFEVSDDNSDNFPVLLTGISQKVHIICIGASVSDKIRSLLLGAGISDFINSNSPDKILSFIENIQCTDNMFRPRIAVVDDCQVMSGMLNRLVTRFDFELLFIKDIDSLLEIVDDNMLQMILLNLGTENLDTGKLIKSSYINPQIKKIPVVTYKDMKVGLFVHELISGLNRITRVILSAEELYSFLLDVLYRLKVIPLVKTLNDLVNFENNICYNSRNLMQICNISGEELYSMENIIDEDRVSEIYKNMDSIRRIMILIESLKWLKMETDKSVSTCGVSGRS